MTTEALALGHVTKRFGALTALDDASLRVERGTIHAVVGENGAGKSTLLRIAYGETRADAGALRIHGDEVPLARHSPAEGIRRRVGMVHQHFMLVPTLTVTENVVLGREPSRGGRLDLDRAASEIAAVSARVGLDVAPTRLVSELSVGERQRVEIVKVLWRGADVLLLDEPTAVLTPMEVASLFGVLRALAGEGTTLVLVTHKLDEVEAIADRVTVMRRGRVTAELPRGVSREAVARAMVGGDVEPVVRPPPRALGPVALDVSDLRVSRARGAPAVDGVTLMVRAGEILGVAGVQGNGQTELVLAIAGLARTQAGQVGLMGRDVTRAAPGERQALGLGHVPEDRHGRGLVLEMTLAENLILGQQRAFSGPGRLDFAHMERNAAERLTDLDVRPADSQATASTLSGGNQQKVVLARELGRSGLRVLVVAEPTRGVDIGATALIHRRLLAAAAAGVAVLVVSSELSELRALCDRVAVMLRGKLVAVLDTRSADDATLSALMTGARTTVT